jgi:hypothetical protein
VLEARRRANLEALAKRAELEALGLPVKIGVGDEERNLMMLYAQPRGRMPAVENVPGTPPERPECRGGERCSYGEC